MINTPILMSDRDNHHMRILRRRDETVLITAIKGKYTGTKKSWEYPKEFDIEDFISKMKLQGFEVQ